MNGTTLATPSFTDKIALIVVVGATAVGKTSTAIRLARRFQGEVISADSRYLYRGLDIGTATPSEAEMAEVPHHLINILDPEDDYTLAHYQRDAMAAIADVARHGRLPILAGGTPLYLNALLEGWRIPEVPPDPAFRAEMEVKAAKDGPDALHRQLATVDPVAAERIPPGNVRRVIRALEIHRQTGRRMSELEGKEPPPWRTLVIGLTLPREELYRRIDERVDQQIADGLVDEVRELLRRDVSPDAPAMSAIGYPQIVAYLAGQTTLEEAVERIKFDTHRYVRHQSTWLKRMPSVHWFEPSDADYFDQIIQLVTEFLAT
ncbi:MAG TPA: tRNA (adenosine(37)-N6)-dimethylallyltransferase MiaA [Nitrolancea sp.]|jgi:tRNA dimethylallyltransferase|nr:tRNA (adenosine(37)-N6)-dimethylallyltransferase MiaA [Nitrolancea sp.]